MVTSAILMGLFSWVPLVAYGLEYVAGDIWMGTDGQVMSEQHAKQWSYVIINGGTGIGLDGVGMNGSYKGSVTAEGEIIGVMPASINGLPVVRLDKTFYNNHQIKKAPVIPDTVTNMWGAYYGCINLVEVQNLPINLVNMEATFSSCYKLTTVPDIPSGVTNMKHTFADCRSLVESPTLPNSVTEMTGTFYQCYSLTTVRNIPNNIISLNRTFQGCTSLVNVPDIPSSVENMEETFKGCTSLITAPKISINVKNLYSTFMGCTALTGEIIIPDGTTGLYSLFDVLRNTIKPITMFYSTSNIRAASVSVPSNVTKIGLGSIADFENSKPVASESLDGDVIVLVLTTTGDYSVEVGGTLQFQATVNRDDLQYRWVIQDLFDTNGQNQYYASINENGVVTGVEAGYAIVGLMVKFEDNSEHAYGLTLVEITSGGQTGYNGNGYYTVPGSYVGGWNYGYSSYGSTSTWFTASNGGGNFIFNPNLGGGTGGTGDNGGGTGGTGGSGGTGGTGSGGTSPYPSLSNAVTKQDTQIYETSTNVSGNLFDKSNNYLRIGNSTQIDVASINPDNSKYKLVSKSLTSNPSVLINQAGVAVGNYEGVSLILLLDENNKVIDTMLMYVGNTDTLDGDGEEALNNASEDPNDYGYVTEVGNVEGSDGITVNPDYTGTGHLYIRGYVEDFLAYDITGPVDGLDFMLDSEMRFITTEAYYISNTSAPIMVSIASVTKDSNAPNLVEDSKFTDYEWNNLSRQQTKENILLKLNGVNIINSSAEIGLMRSGYSSPSELPLILSAKYGKAWGNSYELTFNYNLIIKFAMV